MYFKSAYNSKGSNEGSAGSGGGTASHLGPNGWQLGFHPSMGNKQY